VDRLRRAVARVQARRDEKGSVIVEAAIIIPLLLILTFGAIEFGIAFRDAAAVAASTRSGARLASTLSTADDATFSNNVSLAVSDSLHDLISATPTSLVIYRADANGNVPGGTFTSCSDCWRFHWDTGTNKWVSDGNADTWTQAERQAAVCRSGALPSVGVYVKATQKNLTGLFGPNRTTDQKTAMRLEPPSTDQCP
jgi:Flp pilus assembly protein TadG